MAKSKKLPETTEVPTDDLVDFAFFLAYEVGEWYVEVDDETHDVDSATESVNRSNVTDVEVLEGGVILVHGTGETREFVKRIPATRWNPPETVTRKVSVLWTIEVTLEDGGYAETYIEVA